MPAILWLIGSGAAALGAGYFIKSSGQAVEDTSNALVKYALAAGVLFIIAKKTKLI